MKSLVSLFRDTSRRTFAGLFAGVVCVATLWSAAASAATAVGRDGIVKVRSHYSHEDTVARLKKDVEGKGIRFFDQVEQSKLAVAAGIDLKPSTLLIFGNPALGSLFVTANPLAGLDWPVRLLVFTDAKDQVWVAYTDFGYIARRHRIRTNLDAFTKATGVIRSIVSSVSANKTAGR